MKLATSTGTSALRLVSAWISPSLDHLDDLLLDRLADALQLLGPAVERELGDRGARLADAGRGPPVGGDPEGVAALELDQVGEKLELRRERRVARQRAAFSRSFTPT